MDRKIINLKIKLLQLLILILLPFLINAQSYDTVYVFADSIKENSISLDGVWLYHQGDDSSWASPEFDASAWDTLKSRMVIEDLPRDTWEGIGWFRTVIKIDSSLRFKPIAFEVSQYGASEFYLNGKLIKKLGEIGEEKTKETPLQPGDIPFTVLLDSSTTYLIAVRYSNKLSTEDEEWYKSWFEYIGFDIDIREIENPFLGLV